MLAIDAITPSTQRHAIAGRRADRQGSAPVQATHFDNSGTAIVRPDFSAAIFPRVGAKQNAANRHAGDVLRETVRAAA